MTPVRTGSEADFQIKVENIARFHGWRVFHAPDNRPIRARKSGRTYVQQVAAGFPDLVLVRGPELIFAELKTERGRASSSQTDWLEDLGHVANANDHVEVYLWRPGELEAIERRLARLPHELGICPACESSDVGETLVTGVMVCHAKGCGATWSGVRRRLAA